VGSSAKWQSEGQHRDQPPSPRLAKIGQLVLNRGVWQRKQIVLGAWIAQSTAAQIKASGQYWYGFQWWLGRSSSSDRIINWITALGSNAQKIIVIPELDLVVVFNASRESKNMVSPEIELFDQYILPIYVCFPTTCAECLASR
jgi:CubicO group peptidase (beta-lactamase class C family)